MAFSQPVTPTLTSQLAQAASGFVSPQGFRGFQSVYFVASYAPVFNDEEGQDDYGLHGPFTTETEANQSQQQLGDGYAVFGPFSIMPNEFTGPPATAAQSIVGPISLTPQAVLLGGPPLPPINISGPIDLPAGTEQQPQEYDALFFSQAAVLKFVIPYYTGIYGPGFAADIQDQLAQASVALLGHLPWSEYQTGEELRNDAVMADPEHPEHPEHPRLKLDVLHVFVQRGDHFEHREVRQRAPAEVRA